MYKKYSNFYFVMLVCFGLLSAVVLPPIVLGGLGLYMVTFISPLVMLVVIFAWKKYPFAHSASFIIILLGLMVIFSSVHSWAFGYSPKNSRDIIEAVKYIQFLPFLLAIPFMGIGSLNILHRAIMAASAIAFLVACLQIAGLGEFISIKYLGSDSAHVEKILKRITLTGSDPNIGGVIAGFFCIYCFSIYAVNRKNLYFALFLIFFIFSLKTQSRTALIGLVFGLGVYYIFYFKSHVLLKSLASIISICMIIFLVFYFDFSYIYVGFEYALRGENNSLNVRLENIRLAYVRFLESPFLGVGPAKSSFSTIIDSEYALILQRYGLLGVFVFLYYIIYLIRLSYRNLDSHWGVALFSFTLLSIIVMITNNIFSGYQLMSLMVILNIACILNERSKLYIQKGALV